MNLASTAIGTVDLHHLVEGPDDAPAVFLGASLGTTHRMWDDLAADLATDYRVVRFDTRGHGESPVPAGPYSMAELAADVVALADRLGLERFAYLGLSLGGAIGQHLALDHSDRLLSLTLACTAPAFGDPTTWRERSLRVQAEGTGWLVETTAQRWFPAGIVESEPARRVLDMLAQSPPVGYAGCCDAIADHDVTSRLGEIDTPTLVITAAEDPATPPEVTQLLVEGIPWAGEVTIQHAAHIANVAQPGVFNAAVREHLDRTTGE